MAENQVKITLTGSLIGSNPKQRATAKSIGLRKIGDAAVHADGAVIKGKINVISHLVKVESI